MNLVKMVFAPFVSEYPVAASATEPPPKPGTIAASISRPVPWLIASVLALVGGPTDAASLSVTDAFQILEQASVNDTGASTKEVLFIGANQVVPNGNNGTTGVATSSDLSIINHPLLNLSSTAFPNQISTGIGADAILYNGSNPNLLNPWTLTFTNGPDTKTPPHRRFP
jgi:hypothetical protein